MNAGKMLFCLFAGWMGLQTLASFAATVAVSVTADEDAMIDTRLNVIGCSDAPDGMVDTRINFVVRSPESGSKVDTLTPIGSMFIVR